MRSIARPDTNASPESALHAVAELFPDLFSTYREREGDGLLIARMASALVEAQRLEPALALYGSAIALQPRVAQIQMDRAEVLTTLGRYEEAAAAWERAAALTPEELEPRRRLAQVLHVYLKRTDAAVGIFGENLRRASAPQDYQLLAECLLADRPAGHVVARVLETLDGGADDLAVCQGVADALVTYGRFEEAEALAGFVLDKGGDTPTTLCTLALARILQAAPDRALPALERVLAIAPTDPWAVLLTFCTRYSLGGYDEARAFCLRSKDVWVDAHPPYAAPAWSGEPLAGKRILVHHERHGFGDAIQFTRLAAPLTERGARVFVVAQHPIKPLLARCEGVEKVVSTYDDPPVVDFECEAYAPWVLLPLAARELPEVMPPIALDPHRVAARRARLTGGGLAVGIVWEGTDARSWRPRTSASRSIPLVALRPLAALDGVRLYSLQPRSPEVATWEALGALTLSDLSEACRDFSSLAETIAALDVVIAVDTAAAHLAGALGTHACVLLPRAAEWRWEQDRTDSPWYPSVRLFRQRHPGVWSHAIDDLAEYLGMLVRDTRATRGK